MSEPDQTPVDGPAPQRILVVDDELELREMMEEYLSTQGMTVFTASGGTAMRQVLAQHGVDLVLLDVRMPGEDGLTLARYLRQQHRVGIIMLTAAGDTVDRVVGLEVGADDYIAKPFDPREVLARIKSVLRRLSTPPPPAQNKAADQPAGIGFGRCILNLESHQLFDRDGVEIPITSMEFDLLKAFATHPNRVLSRDQLLNMAHNRDWEPFDRSIDIRVTRLRRKVEEDPAKPQTIKTVRGAGYLFVPNRNDQ
ncbi:MAG: response regulator [Candidatus Competibacteraceae bacterium]|nr:response regulator [Candidatus Competibacteraceae bacterium]